MKESIPSELLNITQGIIIVPKLINAGFVLSGKRGKGLAMVKSEDLASSNPVFVTLPEVVWDYKRFAINRSRVSI